MKKVFMAVLTAALYRTDTDGTIVCETDGAEITFRTLGKDVEASGEASGLAS